jgi:predicted nucleotidyltransferase
MADIKLQYQIERMVKAIVDGYQPEKIILFGSAARGEAGSDSDVDLFIVKQSSSPKHKRSDEIYDVLWKIKGRPPVDVLVFTPEEVKQRVALGDFFITDIVKEGKVLYDTTK